MNRLGEEVLEDRDRLQLAAKALSDPVRLRILEMLSSTRRRSGPVRNGRYGICVNEFARSLGLLQSLISYHMKVLKEAGLVNEHRQGRSVYYYLYPEGMQEFRTQLAERFRL